MKRSTILSQLFYPALWLAAALFFWTGCTVEEIETPSPVSPDGKVTIELNVPDFDIPTTRSIEGSKGEAAVQCVDLLIFDKGTNPPMLLHWYPTTNVRQSSEGPYYKVSFDVDFTLLQNARTLAVIANAPEAVALSQTNPGGVTDGDKRKPSVMSWLRHVMNKEANGGTYKWNTSTPGYTPIPMYGEMIVDGITPGMTISGIWLHRMLARIDVENQVNGSIFQLQEIALVNYEAGGFVAPAWNPVTGILLTEENETDLYPYIYSKNIDPRIPNTAPTDVKPGTEANSIKYAYTQSNNAPGPLLAGEIYTFEAVSSAKVGPSQRIGLILKGLYKGTETYYRVDFTTDKGGTLGAGEVAFMPLYRNHKYTVTITDAEGIGYKTFNEALNSNTVLSNLKTTVMVVDMAGIKDIVYDGQYYMGVESREREVLWNAGETAFWRVNTNYTGTWRAEILNPALYPWLRFSGGLTEISGSNLGSTGLSATVSALSSPWSGNDAQIRLTNGRLEMILTVKRTILPSAADKFARSNIVWNGSKLTFAVTQADNATMPAYSQGVFFKWGSLVALGPAGVPYAPGTHVMFNPTAQSAAGWGNGLAGWDKIPYAHSNFGYTGSAVSGNNRDDFADYALGKGFNATSGIGDICRYISNRGWVDGYWRLPTYAEILELYGETSVSQKGGSFVNLTNSSLNATPITGSYQNGLFNPASGWWLGAGVTASTTNMGTPPNGTVFLPAAGHRYPNGDGDVVHAGAYGYYWTATPYDNITVMYPLLNSQTIGFYDADRSYAFPVRCVRNE